MNLIESAGLDKRLPKSASPCAMVLFGASGNLAHKRILPALYDLANRGLLPANFALIGVARRPWTGADLKRQAHAAVASRAATPFRQQVWEDFAARISYVDGDVRSWATFERLKAALAQADSQFGTQGKRLFHLALPPDRFIDAVQGLLGAELADRASRTGRLVVERPYGFDGASAKLLDTLIHRGFSEASVFRLDPHLGNELIRSFVALRFTNRIFEAVWNRDHVEQVEITMGDDQGIDAQAHYYDQIGALRDVMAGHMLQLLALTAMECPKSMTASSVRASREAVLKQVRLAGSVDQAAARGQYTAGWQGNVQVKGYLDDPAVPNDSTTETFAALKLAVDSDRWRGVPFFLRTGKRVGRSITQVAFTLKQAPWKQQSAACDSCQGQVVSNSLIVRLRPDSAVTFRINSKVPNSQTEIRPMAMDFSHGYIFAESLPEGFEQDLFDVLIGEKPYLQSRTEVAESWRIVDPVLKAWAESNQAPPPYPAGHWGPPEADALPASEGLTWRRP